MRPEEFSATVGAYEAKTHFSQLLDRVAQGERILITRRGIPVAILLPYQSRPPVDFEDLFRAIRAFQARHTLGPDLTLRDLIEEGRR